MHAACGIKQRTHCGKWHVKESYSCIDPKSGPDLFPHGGGHKPGEHTLLQTYVKTQTIASCRAGTAGKVEIHEFKIGFRSTSWRGPESRKSGREAGRAGYEEMHRFRIGFRSTSWRESESRKSGPGGRECRRGGNP